MDRVAGAGGEDRIEAVARDVVRAEGEDQGRAAVLVAPLQVAGRIVRAWPWACAVVAAVSSRVRGHGGA
ncbi:hypothetical protein [Streptomyces sp. NPDC001292]|uniref:hypothetical protein n=1 Tax=Streptomyces sp. NPDC001292 TaxID=3364558 RepID=UPI0036C198FB